MEGSFACRHVRDRDQRLGTSAKKPRLRILSDQDHRRVRQFDTDRGVDSLNRVLPSENYEVVLAANAQEAFENGRPIGLSLVDLGLPAEEGWTAVQRIKAFNAFLPIIVMTRQSDLRELVAAAGVSALVERPIAVPALLQTLRELLAEPVESRVQRIYNHESDFRHVPRREESFEEVLLRRYAAPFPCASPCHHGGINE